MTRTLCALCHAQEGIIPVPVDIDSVSTSLYLCIRCAESVRESKEEGISPEIDMGYCS